MSGRTAPNRPLDLAELGSTAFRRILNQMDALTAREAISYLHPSKRWEYPWALSRATLSGRERLLDVGCGASIFPIYLARRGLRVTALDRSPPHGLAQIHHVPVDYVAGDLIALPFADESFDEVFCISVIEHLGFDRMAVAMGEMHRVLRPGGRLLLTTDFYEDAGARLWYEGPGEPFAVEWSFFDEQQLRHHILDAPGWRLDGGLDLAVDWERMKPLMRRFHGYPYTSVGVALERA